MNDGDAPVSLSFAVKPAVAPVVKTAVGVWNGSVYSNPWVLTINSDNTCTLKLVAATLTGTWSGDSSTTITLDLGTYTGTCTYTASSDTLKGDIEDDDYNDYNVDFTRQ